MTHSRLLDQRLRSRHRAIVFVTGHCRAYPQLTRRGTTQRCGVHWELGSATTVGAGLASQPAMAATMDAHLDDWTFGDGQTLGPSQ